MAGKKIIFGILIVLMASFVYAEIQWGNPAYSGVWTVSNFPVCKTDSRGVKYWEKSSDNGLVDRTNSVDDCYRADGLDELLVANDKCCPANKPLCLNNNGEWKCESRGEISIMSCEDFSADECGSSQDIAIEQLTNSNIFSGTKFSCSYSGEIGKCAEYVDCICEVNAQNICKPNAKLIIWDHNAGTMYTKGITENIGAINSACDASVSTGDCFVDIKVEDNCDTANTKGISWTTDWTGGTTDKPDYCKPGSKEVPCPAQLGFASLASIIIAIALIVILYIIISRKKKKAGIIKKAGKKKRR